LKVSVWLADLWKMICNRKSSSWKYPLVLLSARRLQLFKSLNPSLAIKKFNCHRWAPALRSILNAQIHDFETRSLTAEDETSRTYYAVESLWLKVEKICLLLIKQPKNSIYTYLNILSCRAFDWNDFSSERDLFSNFCVHVISWIFTF
jgi:hypothetical protein